MVFISTFSSVKAPRGPAGTRLVWGFFSAEIKRWMQDNSRQSLKGHACCVRVCRQGSCCVCAFLLANMPRPPRPPLPAWFTQWLHACAMHYKQSEA